MSAGDIGAQPHVMQTAVLGLAAPYLLHKQSFQLAAVCLAKLLLACAYLVRLCGDRSLAPGLSDSHLATVTPS